MSDVIVPSRAGCGMVAEIRGHVEASRWFVRLRTGHQHSSKFIQLASPNQTIVWAPDELETGVAISAIADTPSGIEDLTVEEVHVEWLGGELSDDAVIVSVGSPGHSPALIRLSLKH